MKYLFSFRITVAILVLSASVAFGQWTQTDFADSVGIDAMVTEGTKVFVAGGGGGVVPLPVVAKPNSIYDMVARSVSKLSYTHTGNLASEDSLGTGVYMSSDSGSTWVPAGLQDTTVFAMTVLGKDLFAIAHKGVFRSSDDGANWELVDTLYGGACLLETLDVDSIGPGKALIFATAGGPIFISKDTGTSWTQVYGNFSGAGGGVTSLASEGPELFAGTWYGPGPITSGNFSGVFKSTDYGASWKLSDTLRASPQCIAIKGNVALVGTRFGVYFSTDSGTTWSSGKQDLDFFSIRFVGDNVLAGTAEGIYRSTDDGNTWTPVNNVGNSSTAGMLSVTSTDVFAASGVPHTDLPRLFMGPASEVIRAPISEVTPVIEPPQTVPDRYSLFQNYPNPFNPSTVIQFDVPRSASVTLKVYDVLGRLVRTLVNKVEQPGSYTVTFDAGELPSGVYFYRLDAGTFSETKKLMLIR